MFRYLKTVSLMAVASFGAGAADAKETQYKCQMTANNGFFVAKTYDLAVNAEDWTAMVQDSVSSQASGRAVRAKIQTQNAKRVTIVWKAENVKSDPKIINPGTKPVTVLNSLTLFPDGRVRINAVVSSIYKQPSYLGTGRCTKVDG